MEAHEPPAGGRADLPNRTGQVHRPAVAFELDRANGQVAPPHGTDDCVVTAGVILADPIVLHDRRRRVGPEEMHGRADARADDKEREKSGDQDHRLLRTLPRPATPPGRAIVHVLVVFVVLVGRPGLPPGGLVVVVLVEGSPFRLGWLVFFVLVVVVAADGRTAGPVL